MRAYHAPLDPRCRGARKIAKWAEAGYADPMTAHYGCSDVISTILAAKERQHRLDCRRCQDYGAVNIEVEG
jgi:hypothetical protein